MIFQRALIATPDTPPASSAPVPRRRLVGRLLHTGLIPRTPLGRRLAVIAAIDSCGTGMFLTGSALFFTRILGLTAGQVGLGLTVAALVGLAVAVPIGVVADKARSGRVYISLQVWRGIWFLAYSCTWSFPGFLLVACCIGLADTVIPAVNQAVVGSVTAPEDRVDTLAKIRAVRNIGFGAGALAATGVIQAGTPAAYRLVVVINAVSFFLAALLLWRSRVTAMTSVVGTGARPRSLVRNARYVAIALMNGVLSVHMTLLSLALPLWISQHTRISVPLIGLLVVLNTVLAVALQARFAAPATELRGAMRCMRWAGYSLAGFGVAAFAMGRLAPWSGAVTAVIAVVLLTFGEMWQSAGGWTISYELADPARRAQYLSTFQLGTGLQAVLGPWMLTRFVFTTGGGWLVFAAFVAATAILVRFIVENGAADLPSRGEIGSLSQVELGRTV